MTDRFEKTKRRFPASKTVTSWLSMIFISLVAMTVDASDAPMIIIERVRSFDPESEQMLPERNIIIRGSEILSVIELDTVASASGEVTRIDGKGQFALLGLIDTHVHVVHVLDFAPIAGDKVLPLYLAAGVTSVLSTGDEVVAATVVSHFAAAPPESSPRVRDDVVDRPAGVFKRVPVD